MGIYGNKLDKGRRKERKSKMLADNFKIQVLGKKTENLTKQLKTLFIVCNQTFI